MPPRRRQGSAPPLSTNLPLASLPTPPVPPHHPLVSGKAVPTSPGRLVQPKPCLLAGQQFPSRGTQPQHRHISVLLKGTSCAVYPALVWERVCILKSSGASHFFPGYYHKKLGFTQLLFCASQDCHFGFCAGAAGVRLASQRELNP